MGLIKIAIIIAIIMVIMTAVTGGRFLEIIIPNSPEFWGQFYCKVGGYIVNPTIDLNGVDFPLPSTDNLVVGLAVSLLLLRFWFKKFQSKRRMIIAFLVTLIVVMYLYTGVGLIMVNIAEVEYGLTSCGEEIDLGIITIQYDWFQPLLYLGVGMMVVGVAIALYKAYFWQGNQ